MRDPVGAVHIEHFAERRIHMNDPCGTGLPQQFPHEGYRSEMKAERLLREDSLQLPSDACMSWAMPTMRLT